MISNQTACIRPMRQSDLTAVVEVHLAAFPEFFLSSLGARFLKLFYDGIIRHPAGLAFVAETNVGVTGFVTGSSSPGGFYRALFRAQWWRFALAATAPLMRHPARLRRLIGGVSRRVVRTGDPAAAELMSIAMHPTAQGKGMGRQLVLKFLEEARGRGAVRVSLATDRWSNDRVNTFYQGLGFTLAGRFKTEMEREMNEYEIMTRANPPSHNLEPSKDERGGMAVQSLPTAAGGMDARS